MGDNRKQTYYKYENIRKHLFVTKMMFQVMTKSNSIKKYSSFSVVTLRITFKQFFTFTSTLYYFIYFSLFAFSFIHYYIIVLLF